MKVLVLHGSPKAHGSSSTLAGQLLEGLGVGGEHEVTEYHLNDLSIRPCQGCHRCRKSNRCYIQDDMQPIYQSLENCELVVFAVPIYWWHMTAQMKLCMDRMTALLTKDDKLSALANKRVVAIVTYSHEHCAQATIAMFEEFRTWINIKLDVLQYCSRGRHVSSDTEVMEMARELGQRIAAEFVLSKGTGSDLRQVYTEIRYDRSDGLNNPI